MNLPLTCFFANMVWYIQYRFSRSSDENHHGSTIAQLLHFIPAEDLFDLQKIPAQTEVVVREIYVFPLIKLRACKTSAIMR